MKDKYLFIVDGADEVGQRKEPPTKEDITMIDQGYLFVFKCVGGSFFEMGVDGKWGEVPPCK